MYVDFLSQFQLMGMEALLLGVLLLAFFHFRSQLGLASLHATIAMFYQLATVMAGAFFLQVDDELLMNPASIVLFPAATFALLLVYIREDTRQARHMAYGMLSANLVVAALGLLVAAYLERAIVANPLGLPAELFARQPRLVAAGALALLVDAALVLVAYDYLGRFFRRHLFVRIYTTSALVLAVESLIFVTGGFLGTPYFEPMLASAVTGKLVVALVYSALLCGYLLLTTRDESQPSTRSTGQRVLTYRERFEHLQEQSMRDPLTGLLNRGAFDNLIRSQLAQAQGSGPRGLALLMVDIDRFKQVNDQFGHPEGDKVIRAVSSALQATVRGTDYACRFGGEEFAILLPDIDPAAAFLVAERMRQHATQECRAQKLIGGAWPLTISVGLATAPFEASTAEGLIQLADRRLYQAKSSGRDRVSTGSFVPLAPAYAAGSPA